MSDRFDQVPLVAIWIATAIPTVVLCIGMAGRQMSILQGREGPRTDQSCLEDAIRTAIRNQPNLGGWEFVRIVFVFSAATTIVVAAISFGIRAMLPLWLRCSYPTWRQNSHVPKLPILQTVVFFSCNFTVAIFIMLCVSELFIHTIPLLLWN